jgi:hypothetical protein
MLAATAAAITTFLLIFLGTEIVVSGFASFHLHNGIVN